MIQRQAARQTTIDTAGHAQICHNSGKQSSAVQAAGLCWVPGQFAYYIAINYNTHISAVLDFQDS